MSSQPGALPPRKLPLHTRALFALLERLERGCIRVTLPNGEHATFSGARPGTHADMHILDWRLASAVMRSGDIGLGEAYRDGWFETSDLTKLLVCATENAAALDRAFFGKPLVQRAYRLLHALRANSKRGSRKNIAAHYDLSNDFYALWLDSSMTYSCADFSGGLAQDLASAQREKYAGILAALQLRAREQVLEIGCGWGGFAECLLRQSQAQLRAITLSKAQLTFAQQRLGSGHEQRLQLALEDYRDTRGTFDRIVSIEMFEAVGERYWPHYFAALRRLLSPEGIAVVQTITIEDSVFDAYRRQTDFIQQYIFPGGMLPGPTRFAAEAKRAKLRVTELRALGASYAETLKRWRLAFDAAREEVSRQGFSAEFMRLWRFYFCFCEAGFLTERTDAVQFKLVHDN